MPFPISFSSFGDIVTAIDLALRISKALSSSAGSSYEYQYLIQELDALAHVLQLADTATRTGMLRLDVVRALVAEIARCREVMNGLWERIRGYHKALGEPLEGGSKWGKRAALGSSWRKIGWALFKTHDVQETRTKLATHRANLTTLMTACNLRNIDELKTQCVRFEKTVHLRLSELYDAISQLPRKIGYTDANAIIIVDWRGLETVLPLHLVDVEHGYAQLRATLAALTFRWPEYLRLMVTEDAYDFLCDRTKTILGDDELLAKVLHPGRRIRLTSLGLFTNHRKRAKSSSRDDGDPNSALDVNFGKWKLCRRCWRATGTNSFIHGQSANMDDTPHVAVFGSSPVTATFLITVEEEFDKLQSTRRYVSIAHDPFSRECSWVNMMMRHRYNLPSSTA